jgi:hypothetical protein
MTRTEAEDILDRVKRFLRELENAPEFTGEHQQQAGRFRRQLDEVSDYVHKGKS